MCIENISSNREHTGSPVTGRIQTQEVCYNRKGMRCG